MVNQAGVGRNVIQPKGCNVTLLDHNTVLVRLRVVS